MSACSPAVRRRLPPQARAPRPHAGQTLIPFASRAGLNYVACLEDSSGGGGAGRSELVIFSSSIPGNFTREQCNSVCFAASHRYGGLGGRHECLCSTNSEPNLISESHCSAACTNPQVMEVIGAELLCSLCCKQISRDASASPVIPLQTNLYFADQTRPYFLTASREIFVFSPVVCFSGSHCLLIGDVPDQ